MKKLHKNNFYSPTCLLFRGGPPSWTWFLIGFDRHWSAFWAIKCQSFPEIFRFLFISVSFLHLYNSCTCEILISKQNLELTQNRHLSTESSSKFELATWPAHCSGEQQDRQRNWLQSSGAVKGARALTFPLTACCAPIFDRLSELKWQFWLSLRFYLEI